MAQVSSFELQDSKEDKRKEAADNEVTTTRWTCLKLLFLFVVAIGIGYGILAYIISKETEDIDGL